MITSALCTSLGQMLWKLSEAQINVYLIVGFLLYSVGALLMVVGFKYGELSRLHPLLCLSYFFAIILGWTILGEIISVYKLIGIAVIITGVIFIVGDSNG